MIEQMSQAKLRSILSNTNKLNITQMERWKPHKDFRTTPDEIEYIHEIIENRNWIKDTFHTYFKRIETSLLENFRDVINISHKTDKTIPIEWIDHSKNQWRILALIRDFHDHMCGRDQKHYIRTDDCRRFLQCVIRGLTIDSFPKPVYRLLCGENAPRGFKHPRFIEFN
jgi:hypothetical protein